MRDSVLQIWFFSENRTNATSWLVLSVADDVVLALSPEQDLMSLLSGGLAAENNFTNGFFLRD
jgi:hypothetical protein